MISIVNVLTPAPPFVLFVPAPTPPAPAAQAVPTAVPTHGLEESSGKRGGYLVPPGWGDRAHWGPAAPAVWEAWARVVVPVRGGARPRLGRRRETAGGRLKVAGGPAGRFVPGPLRVVAAVGMGASSETRGRFVPGPRRAVAVKRLALAGGAGCACRDPWLARREADDADLLMEAFGLAD